MSPNAAQAHGLEQHQSYSVSSGTDASPQTVAASKSSGAAIDTAFSHQGKKNCNGSCCGAACVCGMSGLPVTPIFGVAPQRAALALTPYHQTLRQGPPYPLLRPPRLSA